MNETMLQYWNNSVQYWNKFTKSQKITLMVTVFLLLISIPILIYNFSKTEYALAFTDLQPSDAASITQYLTSAKTPYELSPDGKSISVPRKSVASVRVDVESKGLNKNGSIGYGALKDNGMFGETDNQFNIKKLSMIQGELQQMINMNTAVASSKVLITLPENSVFLTDKSKEQASASAVLQLKPGYSLDQQKIDTMYNLVSKSVKNLPVDNITISDQDGNLLPYSKSNGGQVSPSNIAAQQFQVKKQFEQDIQKNVMHILGGVLGPGKVIPMVVATLNFDLKKSTQQLVQPVVDNKGLEISLQEINKTFTGDGGNTGGVAGTGGTDVPGYPGGTASGKTSSEDIQKTVNYEVNRISNEIQSSPFIINDLTISVGVEPPDKNNPASLTQQTKDAIQNILVNVVSASLANNGIKYADADLAKKVTVFDHTFAVSPNATATIPNWYMIGGIGAAALALAAVSGYVIAARRRKAREEAAALAEVPAKPEYPTIDLENMNNDSQIRKQLESLAKRKPDEFVDLLRTWLVDE